MLTVDKILAPMNKLFIPVEKILAPVEKKLAPIIFNPIVSTIIGWLIIINIVHSFDKLPSKIMYLSFNPVVKFICILLAFYYSTKNMVHSIVLAILASILYTIVIKVSEKNEHFDIITSTPDVYPGCVNVTLDDLLQAFDNDEELLKSQMHNVGVPYNLELTEENAKLIATYFANMGLYITDDCRPPHN